MTVVDRTDRQILALLSNNSRMSNKELAGEVELAASSVHERTKRLQESGLLAGSHADVRLDRLLLSLKLLFFIQLSEHKKNGLKSFLKELLHIAEVRAGYMVSGRFDAIVEIVAKDTTHLHKVVVEKFSSRQEIHRIETSIIFESVSQHDLSATLELVD